MTDLNLVVLRCRDLERSLRFYAALGLDLVEEKHGRGPVHYSSALGGVVLELYPARGRSTADVRIGIVVHDIASALSEVRALGGVVESEDVTAALVVDPDGHKVELTMVQGERAVVRALAEWLSTDRVTDPKAVFATDVTFDDIGVPVSGEDFFEMLEVTEPPRFVNVLESFTASSGKAGIVFEGTDTVAGLRYRWSWSLTIERGLVSRVLGSRVAVPSPPGGTSPERNHGGNEPGNRQP